MNKEIITAASCYTEKFYFNPKFDGLPIEIKNELREVTIILSQKLHCIFTIGIYEDGLIYIESKAEESDYNYDEIGAGLEIKKLERQMEKTFQGIEMWYKLKNGMEG